MKSLGISFCLVVVHSFWSIMATAQSDYATPYTFTTLAGQPGSPGSADGTGVAARFKSPFRVAVDGAGNVYVGDDRNYTIRKITAAGVVTTLAGSAGNPGIGDGTGGAAQFSGIGGVAVDGAGNLYVTDYATIRKITPGGVVTTLAGVSGSFGSTDGVGSAAQFRRPSGVAVDGLGTLYVSDRGNNTIRKITSGGVVTTLAGNTGNPGSADGNGSMAQFNDPSGVAVDAAGNVYVADSSNHTIRKIGPGSVVSTLAGSAGDSGSEDGTGRAARFNSPGGVAVDSAGNLYVADAANHTIRKGWRFPPLTIVSHPMNQIVLVGSSVILSVSAVGVSPMTYQWQYNGRDLAGATNDTLTLNNVTLTQSGTYSVMVSNALGTVTSVAAELSVQPIIITTQPQNRTVLVGTNVTFSAAAIGQGPLSYQWQFNGSDWSGATNDTLTLNNVTLSQSGTYGVTIRNPLGMVASAPALLQVLLPSPLDQWSSRASGTTNTLRAVAYGNNVFVAVGDGGTILTSPEGITWTRRSSGIAEGLAGIVYANNTFVAACRGADNSYGDNSPSIILTSPDGITWIRRNSGMGSWVVSAPYGGAWLWGYTWLTGIAQGNRLFVAMGAGYEYSRWNPARQDSRFIKTSPDGITWSAQMAVGGDLTGITYGQNLFVGVGSAGTILSSINGTTWTPIVSETARNFSAVASGANRFVAVGEKGTILTSADGLNWGSSASGTSGGLTGIAYGRSYFVTVGAAGAILSSPDGVTWTRRNSGTLNNLSSVAFGMDTFVVVGAGGTILRSGAFPPIPPSIITQPQGQVVFIGSEVALSVAASGSDPLSYQWRCNGSDLAGATNDTLRLSSVSLNQSGTYTVVISNAGGAVTSAAAQLIVKIQPVSITVQPQSQLVYSGTNVVLSVTAVGLGPINYQWQYNGSDIATATNAMLSLTNVTLSQAGTYAVRVSNTAGSVTSTAATLTVYRPNPFDQWLLRYRLSASLRLWNVIYTNNLFVTVGDGGTILTSPDGVTWTPRDSGTDNYLFGLVYAQGKFVVTGDIILTSSDGISWSSSTPESGLGLGEVAFGNNRFVTVGLNGILRTSTDGLAWRDGNSGTTNRLQGLSYCNNQFVAVGNAGTILTSIDGLNWMSRNSGTDNLLRGIICANNLYVVVGFEGTILTSPDGVRWTLCTSGTSAPLMGITYANSTFVAVGGSDSGSTILASPDGVNWTNRPVTTRNRLNGVTYGNDTFVAIGDGGIILQSGPMPNASSSNAPPVIIQPPQSQTVWAGSVVSLEVSSIGLELSWQWQKEGLSIKDQTNATLTFSQAQITDAGIYTVVVSNTSGSVTSQLAVLAVMAPPVLTPLNVTLQLEGATVWQTNAGATVAFTATTTALDPVSYQWGKNGVPIAGATNAALVLNSVQFVDSGLYSVVVTNQSGYGSTYVKILVGPQEGPAQQYMFVTLAGRAGSSGSVDGQGTTARFANPWGVAVDGVGNVYIADTANHTIRKISAAGTVTTLAQGTTARFTSPIGVAVDGVGNVYIADHANPTIWKISPAGVVTTLVAGFTTVSGVALDSVGNAYVSDYTTIRKITPSGAVSTLAGQQFSWGSGDGAGSEARFGYPYGMAVDGVGNVYVADAGNNTIRKISPASVVTTLAGRAGTVGWADGTGSGARFNYPKGIATDGAGNVYVADTQTCTIRKISPGGVVSTIGGLGMSSGSADGAGSEARFDYPSGVAVDRSGNVYVADTGNNTIRVGSLSMGVPLIQRPLESGVILEGAPAHLIAEIVGYPLPGFQWYFNGQPIAAATNPAYTIAKVSAAHAGAYSLIASNIFGTVTNQPITLTVNNVVASNFFSLILHTTETTPVSIQTASNITGPWSLLADLNLTSSPHLYIDLTATNAGQRFYRTKQPAGTLQPARLEAFLLPGWTFTQPTGSRYKLDYVTGQTGFTNWQFLTNLTLPASPYLFIDSTATNKWPRYYRTTPMP